MGSLRDLYESLTLETLDGWVRDKRQEDLHLDFKELPSGVDRDGRKNLAKAVSGFANSDGGIVVWGIAAREGADGVDCARSLAPIKNVGAVLQRFSVKRIMSTCIRSGRTNSASQWA
jgi:hypothetical protein